MPRSLKVHYIFLHSFILYKDIKNVNLTLYVLKIYQKYYKSVTVKIKFISNVLSTLLSTERLKNFTTVASCKAVFSAEYSHDFKIFIKAKVYDKVLADCCVVFRKSLAIIYQCNSVYVDVNTILIVFYK